MQIDKYSVLGAFDRRFRRPTLYPVELTVRLSEKIRMIFKSLLLYSNVLRLSIRFIIKLKCEKSIS